MWLNVNLSAASMLMTMLMVLLPSCRCYRTSGQVVRTSQPVVSTARGMVQGSVEESRSGRRYLAFRSVPYAKPPVGLLRFASPKAMEPWRGVRDVAEDPPYCTQYNIISEDFNEEAFFGQEDCLYLSVFSHQTDASSRKPVMVYIHGGGFETWTGARMHGPEYFMDHDIVAVFINYRLGPFGFLSTEDSVIPGNFGLKDQLMALRWVRENIAKFGGDPDSVTLFGQSAGAASVHFHMKSTLSRGLFNRAIMNSGSVYSPWALAKPGVARIRAVKSARLLSCSDDDSKTILSCLRTKSSGDIIKLRKHFLEWDTDPFVIFMPVVERTGGFFTEDDLKRKTNVTLLAGVVSQEGAIKVSALLSRKVDYLEQLAIDFEKYAPLTFGYGKMGEHPDLSLRVRSRYFNEENSLTETRNAEFLQNLTLIYSDAWFVSGLMRSILEHRGKLYRYRLDRKPKLSFIDIMGLKFPTGVEGASHSDDLLYFFNTTRAIPVNPLSSEDKVVSEILVTLWTNFAANGYPGGIWRSNTNGDILNVTPNGTFVTGTNFQKTDEKFWMELNKEIEERANRIRKDGRT